MLTSRACWYLFCVLVILALGLLRPSLPLTLLGLTLLLWFAAQWLWFLVRLPARGRLRVEREIWDDRSEVATLWAGTDVRGTAASAPRRLAAHAPRRGADRLPFAVEFLEGSDHAQGVVSGERAVGDRPIAFAAARPDWLASRASASRPPTGRVSSTTSTLFMPLSSCRFCPCWCRVRASSASVKRHNLLLPPGIHRFRRPGSGSELLDLRDYLPGDPPKTIAWKVSARRDRLITKEFESEVPVRCTLFVDTSRFGAGAGPVRLPVVSMFVTAKRWTV